MTPDRWQRLQTVFASARACPPADRDRLLAQECQGDLELRQQVEQMLALDSESKILDTPAALRSAPTPGDKIGPYRIERLLGSGGMGEVFLATDMRLNRSVAVKFSRIPFDSRFRREALSVASLNHSNICTLYDVGDDYLVMEFVNGQTLSQRLAQGSLPLQEVARIAKPIADAVDAAHEAGIVHRDLKPGNIMIRSDGVVKILDFGLAKFVSSNAEANEEAPTRTLSETEKGTILGTAAYMAPEQAMGKRVDKPADVYSFGVVLFEMLTGERLHKGTTTTEVLASVIKDEPRLEKVPVQFKRLLQRCLAKDPQQRPRNISDAFDLTADAEVQHSPPPLPAATNSRWGRWVLAAMGTVLVIVAGAAWSRFKPGEETLEIVRFQILEEGKFKLQNAAPMVSPDGKWVAFQAPGTDGLSRIWLRGMDSLESRPLPGTETPNPFQSPPFWSFDSKTIVFANNPAPFAPGQMKRVDIAGGMPQVICDIMAGIAGAAWGPDNTIVFLDSPKRYLQRVSASGGTPIPVTAPGIGVRFDMLPQFLPDGRKFLYFRRTESPQKEGIYVGSLDKAPEDQDPEPILLTNRQAYYSSAGGDQLLTLRGQTLFAQPFDLKNLKPTGQPVAIADSVTSFAPAGTGRFSVSNKGVLTYNTGDATKTRATVTDRQTGKALRVLTADGFLEGARISPDSTRVAMALVDSLAGSTNLWVTDLATGSKRQVTYARGRASNAVWSPDGQHIAYGSNRNGVFDLYLMRADGTGEERLLLASAQDKLPTSWSVDGYLMYTTGGASERDIWVLPHPEQPGAQPLPYLKSSSDDWWGSFSPDGKWVAYNVTSSGKDQVYLKRFLPDHISDSSTGERWLISRGEGGWHYWASGGQELVYLSTGAVVSQRLDPDKPYELRGDTQVIIPGFKGDYAISPDGKMLIGIDVTSGEVPAKLVVMKNWQAVLQQ